MQQRSVKGPKKFSGRPDSIFENTANTAMLPVNCWKKTQNEKNIPSQKVTLPSLKLTVRPWKWMVGILLSFWEGLFSGAMLVSGRVNVGCVGSLFLSLKAQKKINMEPENTPLEEENHRLQTMMFFRFELLIFRGVKSSNKKSSKRNRRHSQKRLHSFVLGEDKIYRPIRIQFTSTFASWES